MCCDVTKIIDEVNETGRSKRKGFRKVCRITFNEERKRDGFYTKFHLVFILKKKK